LERKPVRIDSEAADSHAAELQEIGAELGSTLLYGDERQASGTLTLASNTYDSSVCGALQDPPGAPGSIPFHDANYSTSFIYRGNPTYVTTLGTSACAAYQTTG
jgi:hypothetical protein